MKEFINLAFVISRPRFWLYLGGTYLVGYTLGATSINEFQTLSFWFHLLFFLFPANIFLYGINDLSDQDTDIYNLKKARKEHLVRPQEVNRIKILIAISLIFASALFLVEPLEEQFLLILFILLGCMYSINPFRFKTKPILDFTSNVLYVLPGFIGFYQTTQDFPSPLVLLSLFFWTSAMHLFSAIPDIYADKRAGITTSATFFGWKKSLILCIIFWMIFSVLTVSSGFFYPFSIMTFLYPIIPLAVLIRGRRHLNRIYWAFPYVNTIGGFILYFLAIQRFI